jgi:replicative DNA helicase
MVEGKIPPQAIDIEKAFLGALLIDGQNIGEVRTILPVDAFYEFKHQYIYSAMLDINKDGGKVDILTVVDSLGEKLESVGGRKYIVDLTLGVVSALHVKFHLAIIYDKWVARQCIKIGSELVEKAYDTDDILDTVQNVRNAMDARILDYLGINSTGVSIIDAANRSIDDYYKREQATKEGKFSGIPSTFKKLNMKLGGFQPEQLIILAGRPGMGKTSLAISFMITAAQFKYRCAFFSLEMTSQRLMDKVICSLANLNHADFKRGKLTEHQRAQAEGCLSVLNNWDVTFNDTMLTSIEQIHANCKTLKDRNGLDMVFIDYLQLMRTSEKTGNRENEISTMSRKAKMMAVDLQVPVILMSQLNRGVESRGDKRPMLSDLRESGAIEQDADIVMFIYRDVVYNDATPNPENCELIVSKHREGETGKLEFKSNESLTRFTDEDEIRDIDLMSPESRPF